MMQMSTYLCPVISWRGPLYFLLLIGQMNDGKQGEIKTVVAHENEVFSGWTSTHVIDANSARPPVKLTYKDVTMDMGTIDTNCEARSFVWQ
jgi:hypothetical protein